MSYLVRKFSHYDLCNVLNNDNKIAKVEKLRSTKREKTEVCQSFKVVWL
jgi:hypothetical protein